MKTAIALTRAAALLALAGWSLAVPSSAQAADFYLAARPFDATMPDASVIPMWGFAQCDATFTSCGPVSSPGPTLRIPLGEPAPVVLHIVLQNELSVPISLVIPAQTAALAPVKFNDATGRLRTEAFTTETAPGAVGTYTWPDFRPGTYLYHSGSQPQVQVQMGLLGAVIFDAGASLAYPGVAYDLDQVLVFSEIDPALHAAVQGGTYGTPAYPDALAYSPRYFLVNGQPFSGGQPPLAAGLAGGRVLLRLLNGGLQHMAPQLLGDYLSLVAENGFAYPFPAQRFGLFLPAGGTADALFVPGAPGTYPLFDRMLSLTNNQATGGGAYAFLEVSSSLLAQAVAGGEVAGVASRGLKEASPARALTSGTGRIALGRPVSGLTARSARVRVAMREPSRPLASNLVRTIPRTGPVELRLVAGGLGAGDADPSTLRISVQPKHGRVFVHPDGTATYRPGRRALSSDTFDFTVEDRAGARSATATVRLNFRD
jgi:FtsP/CotA-like multicopper oxidase with cupredoxin domain